jgi:uncharacterized protein (DUF302 family)
MTPEISKIVNFKKVVSMSVDEAVNKITEALKTEGFGILTRIDFHSKIKEKLGKDIPQTVILGACSPQAAYEVWKINTDFASLIPCNAVVRDLGSGKVSVELAKPSVMIALLANTESLGAVAHEADQKLQRALEKLK